MDNDPETPSLGALLLELSPRIAHLARHALAGVQPPLSYAQYRALLHISRGKKTLTDLRSPATLALSTLSEIIDALRKRGLVERNPSERDRRAMELSLTQEGERALREAQERLDALARRLTASVSPAARAWLSETLAPVNEAAQAELVADHAASTREGAQNRA